MAEADARVAEADAKLRELRAEAQRKRDIELCPTEYDISFDT